MAVAARHQASGRWALGFGLACTTMLLWGALPIGLKVCLSEMDAATITFYRFLGATLIVGGVLQARGRLPRLGQQPTRVRWMLVAAGSFLAINYLLYLLSLDRTTPADAQVLIQIGPFLLALGGLVVFRERFAPLQWLGFASILIGLGLFFRTQLGALAADTLGRERYVFGNALMVGAAATWAVYGLIQKQLLRSISSEQIMFCIYLGSTFAFAVLATPSAIGGMTATGAGALLFCTLNTVVGYGAFAEALEHWEASRVSAVLALTPIATLVMVELVRLFIPSLEVGQGALPWASLAGAGLVVAGSLATSLGAPPPRPSPPPSRRDDGR